MIWLGFIIGFCFGVLGANSSFKKKVENAKDLKELKKML
jgi:hypothetical protein